MDHNLNDRLERDPAPGWRPEVGDAIVGVIVDIDSRPSDYNEGEEYPVLTITRDDDGTDVAVHAFHDVLKKEIAKKRPVVGDRIGVKFLGVPEGRTYKKYRVFTERPVQPDYSKMEAEAAAELADEPGYGGDDEGFDDEF